MDRRRFIKWSLGAAGLLALSANTSGGIVGSTRRIIGRFDPTVLKIALHQNIDNATVIYHNDLLVRGFHANGIEVEYANYDIPTKADVAMIWLWQQENVIKDAKSRNISLLVLERGFFSPRDEWVTMAWDNYNGLGRFAPQPEGDNGKRWQKHFAHLLKPLRPNEKGYALLMGQRPDLFLRQNNISNDVWAQETTLELIKRGQKVVYRPHPFVRYEEDRRKLPNFVPHGAVLSDVDLNKDLEGAGYCVTLCSNVAVETVLAGVPTIALHRASMAWPVASHSLDQPFIYPDRLPWCHDMAWRHWKNQELASGEAWNHIRTVMYDV